MRTARTLLVAGTAGLVLAGFSGIAHARSPDVHVLTIRLPGGGIERIAYTGNVAPRITLAPAPWAVPSPMPAFFGPGSPFAMLNRISAEMDLQMAEMLYAASVLARQPVGIPGLPPGSTGLSFVSTLSASGVCTEGVRITSWGRGGEPHVVTFRSGACRPARPGGSAPAAAPAPLPPAASPDTIVASLRSP